ncbi:pentapeptide repeat-containing protein [Adhaeribacter rhizoryzae]|uniref:Pentapeptide repeat-containing protein n=1 Tax=Adhaeribacter rhizoryzae TaxID=2607907 RepID=A0A5M6CUH8_9BACT|nr:pentapeptide repeat-containing protein [Adhaeribacter rhizoryzae]KAA5538851.1 pentapeptide repeat-containing protein [Adhaeribacter rhizoryzae]
MADENQLKLIREGVKVWNKWRNENPGMPVDLSGVNLSGGNLFRINLQQANLREANLSGANLRKAKLNGADLIEADLREAKLQKANLSRVNLSRANLSGANLRQANLNRVHLLKGTIREANLSGVELIEAELIEADFFRANLRKANLKDANLSRADLREANCYKTNLSQANLTGAGLQNASLVETNLEQAVLTNCKIYGISAWALEGTPANQSNLVVTPIGEPEITVDDLQVAQFVYLLLNNKNVRNIIDTITSKAVLILGRFTPERKAVLDAIADELRKYNLLPIIFDFERSPSRDFTETIKSLASLSFCVIADITNPSSAPLELQATVPDFQIPFVPIIQAGEKPFSMFSSLIGKYDWVLKPVITYTSIDDLLAGFELAILNPVLKKHKELQMTKAQAIEVLSIKDFISNMKLNSASDFRL